MSSTFMYTWYKFNLYNICTTSLKAQYYYNYISISYDLYTGVDLHHLTFEIRLNFILNKTEFHFKHLTGLAHNSLVTGQ